MINFKVKDLVLMDPAGGSHRARATMLGFEEGRPAHIEVRAVRLVQGADGTLRAYMPSKKLKTDGFEPFVVILDRELLRKIEAELIRAYVEAQEKLILDATQGRSN